MQYRPAGGSHIPILTKVLELSDGPVLELGMGPFSTPILHWLCLDKRRQLFSYENGSSWLKENKHFETDWHKITFVEDWDKIDIDNIHWGIAFIDHAPAERRAVDIRRLANKADYIILHDSEESQDKHYSYSEIYPLFKYRYDYKRQKPHTTVLSNFKDLNNLRAIVKL